MRGPHPAASGVLLPTAKTWTSEVEFAGSENKPDSGNDKERVSGQFELPLRQALEDV
jgi:hypothetical protein